MRLPLSPPPAFKVVRCFWAALLVWGCAPGSRPPPEELFGLWESVQKNPQGIGNSLAIGPESTAAKFIVKVYDQPYRVEGGQIVVREAPADTLMSGPVSEARIDFVLSGDTLHKRLGERSSWMVRQGPPPAGADSIAGTWRTERSTDAITVHTFERYTADGRLSTRLPLQARSGYFSVFADTLLLLFPEENPLRVVYRVARDTLWIMRGTDRPYPYLRAADRSWYYLDS